MDFQQKDMPFQQVKTRSSHCLASTTSFATQAPPMLSPNRGWVLVRVRAELRQPQSRQFGGQRRALRGARGREWGKNIRPTKSETRHCAFQRRERLLQRASLLVNLGQVHESAMESFGPLAVALERTSEHRRLRPCW